MSFGVTCTLDDNREYFRRDSIWKSISIAEGRRGATFGLLIGSFDQPNSYRGRRVTGWRAIAETNFRNEIGQRTATTVRRAALEEARSAKRGNERDFPFFPVCTCTPLGVPCSTYSFSYAVHLQFAPNPTLSSINARDSVQTGSPAARDCYLPHMVLRFGERAATLAREIDIIMRTSGMVDQPWKLTSRQMRCGTAAMGRSRHILAISQLEEDSVADHSIVLHNTCNAHTVKAHSNSSKCCKSSKFCKSSLCRPTTRSAASFTVMSNAA